MKLKRIIGEFLSSTDESSHRFLRLWNIGKFGLETEFNLDITGVVKTEILDVNGNKTVNLPCDYIQYIKIGQVNEKGKVVTFKRNDQLATINHLGDNRLVNAPMTSGSYLDLGFPLGWNYYNNYFYGGVSYNLYGADSGTITRGEYKVDKEQGIIFLNPHFSGSQIVLEYLSDGFDSDCDDYEVDVRAASALMAYIRWKSALDMPKKFGMGVVQELKREYYREKRLCKMRMNPWILNEMESASRKSIKLVAKA